MMSLLVKEKLYINEVVLGTGFGVLMGPHTGKVFDPRSWAGDTNALTLEIMRVVLATGLFAIGVELPRSYMAVNAKSLLVMVVPTMAIGWVTSAGAWSARPFVHVLFPKLNYVSGLLISACLTPTDPIICAAIVGGKFAVKHVPLNLRRLLAAESAANDGLAYPFLSISAYLLTESTRGIAFEKWFIVGWLYQVILGTVIGALVAGWLFSQLMQLANRMGYIDRESYIAQYIALTLFTIGVTRTLGSDDLLAAFAAGNAVSWDGHFNDQVEDDVFSSVIDLVLNCACFIYIGAWLPFDEFNIPELGLTPAKLVALFLIILALRRIPALLVLYRWIPEIESWRQALFSGHFGPMGVGAVFISTLAIIRLEDSGVDSEQIDLLKRTLQPIVLFVVLCSIIVHGLSIPFFNFGSHTVTLSRSITRTLTRAADSPDWLLWARREPYTAENALRADVEHGTQVTAAAVPNDGLGTTALSPKSAVIVEPRELRGEVVILEDQPPAEETVRRLLCYRHSSHADTDKGQGRFEGRQ
ncbi:Sodium/hydrogen exchanger family-domain-containing protein [Vararia minispora EC-137]|uniref:Sodium/hydrogen exchanger family-domain-containing protein n=1 Tax=Vararia minispora EC-137 TaxID=1314806 RepID=A0ACB8QE04_9AGAM|nr:Sodium/hydrogen exchanger family-domain-containing protein [Vararia minispora EC-137]